VSDTKRRFLTGEQKFPEPVTGALIFNPQGKLFLMRSHKWHDSYIIPGGHIELGERIEEGLRREVKEETGLDIHGLEFVCFQEMIFDKAFWKPKHFVTFDYACRTRSSEVKLDSEGQEHVWVIPQEALKLPLGPTTRKAIAAFLKAEKEKGKGNRR